MKNYTGPLAKPILIANAGDDTLLPRLEKLEILFQHYDLGPNDWPQLAFALALRHVPGFKEKIDNRKGAPHRLRGLATIAAVVQRLGLADSDAAACRFIAESELEIKIRKRPRASAVKKSAKALQNKLVEGKILLSRKSKSKSRDIPKKTPIEPG